MIEWSDSFSVNVKEIDAQHKNLIQMLNDIHKAMSQKEDQNIVREIISRMYEYAKIHFALEEKYMGELKFSGYTQHKAAHVKIQPRRLYFRVFD